MSIENKIDSNILVVDDDKDLLTAARILLKKHFAFVKTEDDPRQLPALLARDRFDVILLDMNFTLDAASGVEGLHWLKEIQKLSPETVVVLMTAYGDTELAVDAMKLGATDFVLKPWQNEKLLATLTSAVKLARSNKEISTLKHKQEVIAEVADQKFGEFIGESKAMQRVFETIKKSATTDANVLILGESGTGKELVARALHRESNRHKQTFISVDMGTISDNLFESELFGHKKGAFTDARQDRMGRFEAADQGTLFLDEIGNLPLPLQGKLLTAIQQKQITPVGANHPIEVNIRLVCATNADLLAEVNAQQFRQDLLYRINTVEIHLPPLRDRGEDVCLLAEHYLASFAKKYHKPNLSFANETLNLFRQYHWPGNVRELQHAIERAVIMCDSEQLTVNDFPACQNKASAPFEQSLNLEAVELATIKRALEQYQGNVSHAAKALGLTRTSLYRRMEKYAL